MTDDERVGLRSAQPVPRIGIDCHSSVCVDEEGKVECVCGLDDWLEMDPFKMAALPRETGRR